MIASVDVQVVIARSAAGELARGLMAEAAATGGRATQQQREQILLALVLQAIGGLVETIARARGYALVLERKRAGVLFAAPVADITAEVLTAYDAIISERVTREGKDAILGQVKAQIEE